MLNELIGAVSPGFCYLFLLLWHLMVGFVVAGEIYQVLRVGGKVDTARVGCKRG